MLDHGEREAIRERIRLLARLMDSAVTIPGTKISIGIDPLLGVFPWFGDTLGAIVSSFIIAQAARIGAPRTLLFRMAINVAIDALVGAVPFAGDIFDVAWKANVRNVELLDNYLINPRKTAIAGRLFVVVLSLVLAGFVILVGLGGYLLLAALWKALSAP